MSLGRAGSSAMLPGPNALAVGRNTAGDMPAGVTFTHVPGGQVPAATHGSGGSGPASEPPPPPPSGARPPGEPPQAGTRRTTRNGASASASARREEPII